MDSIKERWQTLMEALTVRRVLHISFVFAAVTAAVRSVPIIAKEADLSSLLGAPFAWACGIIVGLFLLVYFLNEHAVQLRRSLLPRIELSCEKRGCVAQTKVQRYIPMPSATGQTLAVTPAGEVLASSVRIWVQAISKVAPRNVSAFLTKFERRNAVGAWIPSQYDELVRLPWVGETLTVNLSNLFPQYVSVLHIEGDTNKIDFWKTGMPFSLVEFFNQEVATYRLTVAVITEDGLTQEIAFELDWRGKWDTLSLRPA
jgi:hypothetical protein